MFYTHACKDRWSKRAYRNQRRQEKMKKWANMWQSFAATHSHPVNIVEMDNRYELFLFAPGLEKQDFKITTANRVLTIEVDKKNQEFSENAKWKIREYRPGGFTRQFDLNKKIDTADIKAEYKDGVLIVKLGKLEDQQTSRQDVPIA